MKRGLFLGKFLPPHNGHLFVCDVARHYVDHLTVLVCSYDAEPIDGFLRANWMRDCVDGPRCTVAHMHRDIPQSPEDHPDFWRIWKDAVLEHHDGPVDVVFGSEEYIHKLAEVLGAAPFVVDIERSTVPVSATAIRAEPAEHWAFIPPAVRPYYQKRVTLIGPESTGKTTLSDRLAAKLRTRLIPEYGRAYDAEFKQGSGWQADDFLAIAERHLAMTAAIAPQAGPMVIEDTNVLQTVVWAEALIGTAPDDLVDLLMQSKQPDLYLLLAPDIGWSDDGTRYHSNQDQRDRFHQRLIHWLEKTNATWHKIAGSSFEQRAHEALKIATQLVDI